MKRQKEAETWHQVSGFESMMRAREALVGSAASDSVDTPAFWRCQHCGTTTQYRSQVCSGAMLSSQDKPCVVRTSEPERQWLCPENREWAPDVWHWALPRLTLVLLGFDWNRLSWLFFLVVQRYITSFDFTGTHSYEILGIFGATLDILKRLNIFREMLDILGRLKFFREIFWIFLKRLWTFKCWKI